MFLVDFVHSLIKVVIKMFESENYVILRDRVL